MTKIYVIDTNVFLQDAMALFSFPKETIVIPLTVIEEIDKMKKRQDEVGKNAREVLRKLDKLKKRGTFTEKDPVELNNGGKIIIELNHTDSLKQVAPDLNLEIADNRIISVAHYYANKKDMKQDKSLYEVILKSNDAAVRLKAQVFGIKAEEHQGLEIKKIDEIYPGYKIVESQEELVELQKNKSLKQNEYVVQAEADSDELLVDSISRYQDDNFVDKKDAGEVWNISPRNLEQSIALDLLLNPEIPLVTLTGKAGTGKTLLALAAGLHLSLDKNIYNKMIVARPIIPMGRDLGYLPGSMEEKMNPWMKPITDNLEFILSGGKESKDGTMSTKVNDLISQSRLQIEPLTYIRGRSIPNQYIIIDEAQNLTLHEVKTILTRIGRGSKVVLCGDPDQIDHAFIDGVSNGLSQIIEKLKDEKLTGHIRLDKGERSELAELVSNKV